jgi:hypothetical protein
MGVSGQHHAQAALYPWRRDKGDHCTGDWAGPSAGPHTEVRGKISCVCQGSNIVRPVVQSVARHYTELLRLYNHAVTKSNTMPANDGRVW